MTVTGLRCEVLDERLEGRTEGRMEGRRRSSESWLRLSARRLAVVNTFSLVSLQMNTAIEATYNINVPPDVSLARNHTGFGCVSLAPTLYRCLHTEWPY